MKKVSLIILLTLLYSSLMCFSIFAETPNNTLPTSLDLWVPYNNDNPGEAFNKSKNMVFIEHEKLNEIFRAKNPTYNPNEKPPVEYQMNAVKFYGQIVGENALITGVYDFEVLTKDWTLVPIISETVALTDGSVDNQKAFITSRNNVEFNKYPNASKIETGHYALVMNKEGKHTAKISFSVPVSNVQSNNPSLIFNFPQTPVVTLDLKMNRKNIEFIPQNAVSVVHQYGEGTSSVSTTLKSYNFVSISWKPKNIIPIVVIQKEKLPATIDASLYNSISIGEEVLRGNIKVGLTVNHSPLDYFEFYVPPDIEIDTVAGSNIAKYTLNDKKNLAVHLTSPVTGYTEFTIEFSKELKSSTTTTDVPVMTLLNASLRKEDSYFGIAQSTNIEIIINEERSKGYELLDPKELPATFSSLSSTPFLIAFRYNKLEKGLPDTKVLLDIVRHEDVPVLQTAIDNADIVTVMSKNGYAINKAILHVRNNTKQFLEMSLPENSEVWSTFVSGEAVKPAKKNDNTIALPLARSIGNEANGEFFPVEIVYYSKLGSFNKILPGFITMGSPAPELTINKINWQVYMPDGLAIYNLPFITTLENNTPRVKAYSSAERFSESVLKILYGGLGFHGKTFTRLDGLMKMPEAPMVNQEIIGGKELEEKAKMEGADYAGQAPEAYSEDRAKQDLSSGRGNYLGDMVETQQYFRKQIQKSGMLKGSLPVHIDLPVPSNNQSFQFAKLILKEHHPATIGFTYFSKSLMGWATLLILFILSCFSFANARDNHFKSPWFIVPSLLLLFVIYLSTGSLMTTFFIVSFICMLWIFITYSRAKTGKARYRFISGVLFISGLTLLWGVLKAVIISIVLFMGYKIIAKSWEGLIRKITASGKKKKHQGTEKNQEEQSDENN